jgi:hypothetical protein
MKVQGFSQDNISEDEKTEMEEQIYRYNLVGSCLKGAKEEYFDGYNMVDLIQKSKDSLRDQRIEDFRKWKRFDDRIGEKIKDILDLYKLSYKIKQLIIMGVYPRINSNLLHLVTKFKQDLYKFKKRSHSNLPVYCEKKLEMLESLDIFVTTGSSQMGKKKC